MKKYLWFLLMVTLVLIPLYAFAEKPSNYILVKGGMYSPQEEDFDLGLKDAGFDVGTNFSGEIAFGHYYGKNFAVELGVGYFGADDSLSFADFTIPLSASINVDTTVIPVTLSGKLIAPIGNLELYGIGGIGVYFASIDIDASLDDPTGLIFGFPISGSVSDSSSDTAFGFHLGVGASVDISQSFFLGAEGKYLWAEAKSDLLEEDLTFDGFQITGNIGYRF